MGKYTTVEAVERRLKGWATVNQAPDAFGTTQLDSALVAQLIEQAEARIDSYLRDRYQLPLKGTHPALASVAEQLTLCKLIGQLYAGQEPSEGGGYGQMVCKQGERELKELKAMDLAGEQPVGVEVGMATSGVRSLPSMYREPQQTQQIDPIRW